ncbi:MAG: ABC transporter ATP-binding protein [Chloroflexota bacterium]
MDLSIRNVTKEFATPEGTPVRALDDVSLEVAANEFLVLLGPSGCGKTTLLRILAGLENADAGEIFLGDEQLDTVPPNLRRVNTVFQSYALFPHLNVERNIAFGLEMEGQSKAEINRRVDEMLTLVELRDFGKRMPSQLSGGQQQRVALARALAKKPQLLLLDEPLSALDLKLRRQMQTELKRIQQSTGIGFVFVTHDQGEALTMGDHIAVMNKGKIAQLGTPRQIYEEPNSRYVADFIGETNLLPAQFVDSGTIRVVNQAEFDLDSVPGSGNIHASDAQELYLAVRPERIAIDPTGQLQGRVVDTTYNGAEMIVDVDLGNDVYVRCRIDALQTTPQVGSTISLRINPQHTRVVTA